MGRERKRAWGVVWALVVASGILACAGGSDAAPAPPPPPPPPSPPPEVTPPARPAPRTHATTAGSCDGLLDYGAELRVAAVRVVGRTYPDAATAELDLELDVENVGGGHFLSASVLPDLSGAADLGAPASPAPLPADFGPIPPGGTATSTAALRVRVASGAQDALVQRLLDGTIPLLAQADELNVLAPGVTVLSFSRSGVEDLMYFTAAQLSPATNPDPGPGPFLPGQEFDLVFIYDRGADEPTVFDRIVPGEVTYLVEDPEVPLVSVPPPLRRVRVVLAEKQPDLGQRITRWNVKVRLTNAERLPDVYTSASHCTGKATHVDPAVQASRVYRLDGDLVSDAKRDANGQPVRVNDLLLSKGAITFSGQVAGHVLKPSLALKLRDGRVEVDTAFENDVSVTAELRAEKVATLDADPAVLYAHCFPMPSFTIGPVTVPMSLGLWHEVVMKGSVGAGARMSFQKHFVGGVGIHCALGPGVAQLCTSESWRSGTPAQLTPPQFTEASGFELRAESTFHSFLRVGDDTCLTGPGLSLDATGWMGYGLSPANDPWWKATYGLDLTAAVDLDLLGLDVVRWESELYSTEQFSSDSTMYPPSPDPAGLRRSGDDQRWSVAVDETPVPNGLDWARVAPLPDGASLVVGTEPVGGRNPVVKLDRHGALVWVKELDRKVLRIHALPDGTAVVVGANAALARLDGDGDLLWSYEADLGRTGVDSARCVLSDVAALEQSPGVYDYVAVGKMGTGLVTTVDACAFRVRDDGTLAWSRIYVGAGGQAFTAAAPTRDGDVVAVGSDYWYFVGNRSVPLVARIDAATGDLRWAKDLPMARFGTLDDVVEAADGTIYAAGNAAGTILTTGAALVVRVGADGGDARHALYLEDADWEAAFDAEWNGLYTYAPFVDTAGGDTAYDTFFGIAASGDGVVVVGTTGLGAGTAARAAKVNANLGVEWMAAFDGPGEDAFTGVAVTAEGVLVAGYSASLPEADGGTGENQLWVTNLPFTGTIPFLPGVPVTVRYSAPGVRASSTDPAVNPTSGPSIDAAFTTEEPILLADGPSPDLLVPASPYCVELLTPTGHPSTADACPDP